MPPTREPPPSGRPPAYAIAGRAFGRTNLRPVLIVCTILGTIWSLVWAAGAFEDMNGDKQNNDLKKLVTFDIVLGSIYAGVAAIELFGLAAAVTRRIGLVRIFVTLSVAVIFIVAGAELFRTIVHFAFKSAIIEECLLEVNGSTVQTSFGFWGGGSSFHTINLSEAQNFCNRAYSRSSLSVILWLLFAALSALFFASIAYSFYRQLLDPTFFRAQSRMAPSDQVRLEAYGTRYDMPPQQGYGGGYNPYPSFAPPPGPPPNQSQSQFAPAYEATKLPGYGEGVGKNVGEDKEDPFKDGNEDPFTDGGRRV